MESELTGNFIEQLSNIEKIFVSILSALSLLGIALDRYSNWFQARFPKQQKINIIEDFFKNSHYIDKKLESHLQEIKTKEVFYQTTKIECKKNLREYLIWLYENTPSNFSWQFIRSVKPYIKEKNGQIFIKISNFDNIQNLFYWSLSFLNFLLVVLLIFAFGVSKIPLSGAITLVILITIIWFFLTGFYFLTLTIPITRAKIIDKEIKKLNQAYIAGEIKGWQEPEVLTKSHKSELNKNKISSNNPLLDVPSILINNPLWDEVTENIAAYRNELDKNEDMKDEADS